MYVITTACILLCFIVHVVAQTITPIQLNSSTVGQTAQTSEAFYSAFSKTDGASSSVGMAGQLLFSFNVSHSPTRTSLRISTCNPSTNFDTYLLLSQQNPLTTSTSNITVVAESANDILCQSQSITHATIYTILPPVINTPLSTTTLPSSSSFNITTYYLLLTGNGNDYGRFNVTVESHPIHTNNQFPFKTAWHLDRIDQRNLPLNNLYSVADKGDDVYVYLIDSGVDKNHIELQNKVITGYDFVRLTDNDTPDCTGHGTHLAALIAGSIYGVAKNVKIIPVRIYGCTHTTTITLIINAINFILSHSEKEGIRNRSIISLMISINETNIKNNPSLPILKSVVNSLISRNLPVIVPAGDNDGLLNNNACDIFPANVQQFLTIGSITKSNDQRALFTNAGNCVNLYAPGHSIMSAWHSSHTAVVSMSGTAQSTAIVTGIAALLLSLNPMLKGSDIKNILFSVGTPNVIPKISKDDIARLVYIRSVRNERKEIPQSGLVLLNSILRVSLISCESNTFKIDALRFAIAESIGLTSKEQNIQISCERITFTNIKTNLKNETVIRQLSLKQTNEYNLEIRILIEERLASSTFVMLERTLSGEEKLKIQSNIGFIFQVVEMPWATDSKEVIYWGAPTFPQTDTQRVSIGVIIAIIMGLLLMLTIVIVVLWLWYRRKHRLDEIESMQGSGDIEKGPIHFKDFEEDDDSSLPNNRSFRNLTKTLSFRNDNNQTHTNNNRQQPTLFSSLGSYVRKNSMNTSTSTSSNNNNNSNSNHLQQQSNMMNTVRLQSFGGEAFVNMSALNDSDDEDSHGHGHGKQNNDDTGKNKLQAGASWRKTSARSTNYQPNAFGRINSELPVNNIDGTALTDEHDLGGQPDAMVVKSLGGEAFAALAHMDSTAQTGGDGGQGEGSRATRRRSDAAALNEGFMSLETEEKIITEDDHIAISPRANK